MKDLPGTGCLPCHSRTLQSPGNLNAIREWVLALDGAVVLESLGPTGELTRFSVYAIAPCRSLTSPLDKRFDPFDSLSQELRPWRFTTNDMGLAFTAGWIGYFSYEAGRFVEPTAYPEIRKHELPLAHFTLYDTLIVHDRRCDEWRLLATDLPMELTQCSRPSAADRLAEWSRRWETIPMTTTMRPDRHTHPSGRWNDSSREYLAKVGQILNYIAMGDVFQVNLARRFQARWEHSAAQLYQQLCRHNPAAFAACIPIGPGQAVISSSPELFIDLRQGQVETRPIKGTRPRTGRLTEDQIAKQELACHPKDRAELNMIIDLERNDLGRVCDYASVEVVSDGDIETLPTVFHRTATIRGRLREECDAIDLLRATFPGGSITGAPKVRAMQIIHELEGFARGPYCGAIGWIGLDGAMQMNLAIRTLALYHGRVDLYVGSGIVADSDPQQELEELHAKSSGMMAALGITPHGDASPYSCHSRTMPAEMPRV